MSDDEFRPSLNELTSLAKKAVRGSGMSWGIAEEAASSVRWLSAHKLPGPELLAGLLEKRGTFDVATLTPQISKQPWSCTGDHVCPLIAGAVFSDTAACWQDPSHDAIEVIDLAYPLLLLPAIAKVSAILGIWLQVSWDKVCISTDGKSACIQGPFDSLTATKTQRFRCTEANEMVTLVQADQRQPVDRDSWSLLETYAHLTYAPDTEESRRLGAGAD